MVSDGQNKDDLKAETGGMARSAEKVKEENADQVEKGSDEVSQKVTEGGGAVSSNELIDEGKVKQDDLSDNSLFLQEEMKENGTSPMSSDKFYTDDEDETTVQMSFHTAMKQADLAEMTLNEKLEETFEGTAPGRTDERDQRSPSPKTSVMNGLKQRVKELEQLLDEKEAQAFAAIRDQRNKTMKSKPDCT
ncbi:uncharacterized protein LOC129594834 [Paramacrobiotus metropolitanus]|uniref:uncharacterized protein LOC129594834 n=1 Tax=Paramacrobiotus metropolitanus TaxID=2943436 RepID=UPI002445D674|nr:uncharacterized protein LOC129594834 [Paramacrobiotus metropolitanus]